MVRGAVEQILKVLLNLLQFHQPFLAALLVLFSFSQHRRSFLHFPLLAPFLPVLKNALVLISWSTARLSFHRRLWLLLLHHLKIPIQLFYLSVHEISWWVGCRRRRRNLWWAFVTFRAGAWCWSCVRDVVERLRSGLRKLFLLTRPCWRKWEVHHFAERSE